MLQVSLFSAGEMNHVTKYHAALGGCHNYFFYIGAFNLANLLTKIPGKIVATGQALNTYGNPVEFQKEQVSADNIQKFLDNFSISHKQVGITISSVRVGSSKILQITCPEGNLEKLINALVNSFKFALKNRNDPTLRAIDDYNVNHFTSDVTWSNGFGHPR